MQSVFVYSSERNRPIRLNIRPGNSGHFLLNFDPFDLWSLNCLIHLTLSYYFWNRFYVFSLFLETNFHSGRIIT